MEIRKQLTLHFLLFSLVPVFLVGFGVLYVARETITKQYLDKLEASAFNLEVRLKEVVKKYEDRVNLIASHAQLRASIDEYLRTKEVQNLDQVKEIVADVSNSIQHLDEIVITDARDGSILVRHGNSPSLVIEKIIKEGVKNKLNFLRKNGVEELKVLLYSPLVLDNKVIADIYILSPAVEVSYLAKEPLGLGETSEVLIARQVGKSRGEFLTPSRYSSGMPFDFNTSYQLPLVHALRDRFQSTYVSVKDYKARDVFAVTRYIKELEWAFLVKIDKDEALANLYKLSNAIILALVAILICSVLISRKFSEMFTLPISNLLIGLKRVGEENFKGRITLPKKQNDIHDLVSEFNKMIEKLAEGTLMKNRLSSIVTDSSDAIYSCDNEGIITSWNKAAENLFGYQSEEIIGKSIDLLMLKDKTTGMKNEIEIIRSSGAILNLMTQRASKQGTEIDTSISASSLMDNEGKVVGLSIIARDIREQKKQENKILQSLREKEVLLKEIHHRVKNNMQVISSLLKLQGGYLHSEQEKNVLSVCENRIRSMSLIHEKLYQSNNFSSINLKGYIEQLLSELRYSYYDRLGQVSLLIDVDSVDLDIERAIPCGLALNEMITNAFKHAFKTPKPGEIKISLSNNNGVVTLSVQDNGCGLPNDFNLNNPGSLGVELIQALSEQLHGRLNIESDSSGTKFELTFPLGVDIYKGELSNAIIECARM